MSEHPQSSTTGLRAIGRGRLADRVAVEICNYIKANDLKPGDRLVPERVLVQELAVGRSSVREALRQLSTLGLIEVRQGDGMYVRALEGSTAESGEPLFDIREQDALRNLIETRLGIELAIATAAAARVPREELNELSDLLDQMDQDITGHPDAEWEPLTFELALAKVTGNNWLYDVEVELAEAWRALSKELRGTVGRYPEWHAEHKDILAAIATGNVAKTQRLVLEHLSLERFEKDLIARSRRRRRKA